MQFQFDTDIAAITHNGDEAALVHHIYYWVMTNEANGRHFHDGNVWMYSSLEALQEIFYYLSAKQIRRMVKNCTDLGLIEVGNYNKNVRDRTAWYAVTETVKIIYRKGQMQVPKRANGDSQTGTDDSQTGKCINETDNRPDNRPDIQSAGTQDLFKGFASGHADLMQALHDFEAMRKAKKKPMTHRAKELLLTSLAKLAPENPAKQIKLLEQSILKCWDSVYPLDEDKQPSSTDTPKQTQGGRKWVQL